MNENWPIGTITKDEYAIKTFKELEKICERVENEKRGVTINRGIRHENDESGAYFELCLWDKGTKTQNGNCTSTIAKVIRLDMPNDYSATIIVRIGKDILSKKNFARVAGCKCYSDLDTGRDIVGYFIDLMIQETDGIPYRKLVPADEVLEAFKFKLMRFDINMYCNIDPKRNIKRYTVKTSYTGLMVVCVIDVYDQKMIFNINHNLVSHRDIINLNWGNDLISKHLQDTVEILAAAILQYERYNQIHNEIIKEKINMTFGANSHSEIDKVIFNNPATIVIWRDGTKTVVKRQKGERWDKEKGLAMAIVKKISGNTGNYNDIFKKWCEVEK